MMHEEIKKRFVEVYLSDTENNQSVYKMYLCQNNFRQASVWEEKFNKDVAEFEFTEIEEMYRSFDCYSFRTLRNDNILFNDYTNYYNQYVNSNNGNRYQYIDDSFLRGCISDDNVKNKYLSYKQFQEMLSGMLNATEKAVCLLLWEGVQGTKFSDILYLERDNVNFKENIIHGAERTYYISKQTCTELDHAMREQYLMSYKSAKYKRVEGLGRLYKQAANTKGEGTDRKRYTWMIRLLTIIKEEFRVPLLTPQQIQESGELYYLKEAASKTGMPLSELLNSMIGEDILRRYNNGKFDRRIRKRVYDKFVDYI